MKKEDYKRLNDYLNDTFIYLSEHDGFFIQNMFPQGFLFGVQKR